MVSDQPASRLPENSNPKRSTFLGAEHLTNVEPDWGIYDSERFPAVQFMLQNLAKLKQANPKKHRQQYLALQDKLGLADTHRS